jgi:hypothetical protein
MLCSQIDVDIDLTTWQYIPEDSELHTRHCENLKSHIKIVCLIKIIKICFINTFLKNWRVRKNLEYLRV